jgi:hypothetical protein
MPNGMRLSCAALLKDSIPHARRQLQPLVRQLPHRNAERAESGIAPELRRPHPALPDRTELSGPARNDAHQLDGVDTMPGRVSGNSALLGGWSGQWQRLIASDHALPFSDCRSCLTDRA